MYGYGSEDVSSEARVSAVRRENATSAAKPTVVDRRFRLPVRLLPIDIDAFAAGDDGDVFNPLTGVQRCGRI